MVKEAQNVDVCIVENFTRKRISKKEIERIVECTARVMRQGNFQKKVALFSVYVHVVGVSRCAQLNKKFRGIDWPTDVLSFEGTTQRGKHPILGEIVLCPQIIQRHARKMHRSFRDEWAHVLIHGTLHVLGHHHEKNAKQEREVQRKENSICKKLGYKIPHQELLKRE